MNKILLLALILISFCSCASEQKEPLVSDCSFLTNISDPSRFICGKLEVPENHDNPDGRKIEIAFVIIKSQNPETTEYPMIHFTGGPGGQALRNVEGVLSNPILKTRDIIRFDQRGIGQSSPLPDLTSQIYGLFPEDITIEEERKRIGQFITQLRETCDAQGIEIEAYNTFQNTEDVGMLMEHLGYDKYNLRGGSYGTRIARVVADRFPEKINAAIYDSPAPHRNDYITTRMDDYSTALSKVFAYHGETKPDLKANYFKILKELEEKPLEATYNGQPFYLNPQDAIFFLRYQLYNNASRSLVPEFIEAFLAKDMNYINQVIRGRAMTSSNYAMFLACENFDEYDHGVTSEVLAAKYKELELLPYELPIFTSLYLESANFMRSYATDEEKEYKMSDVPSLIFVNQYDPVTPPENAEVFQSKMTNSHAFIIDQGGHGGGDMGCKRSIMDAFMSAPNKEFSSACLKLYKQ